MEEFKSLTPNKCGLNEKELAHLFFLLRFNKRCENDEQYCRVWERRFMSGLPDYYLDSESKTVWNFIRGACEIK